MVESWLLYWKSTGCLLAYLLGLLTYTILWTVRLPQYVAAWF
jgi:hypothetical protein